MIRDRDRLLELQRHSKRAQHIPRPENRQPLAVAGPLAQLCCVFPDRLEQGARSVPIYAVLITLVGCTGKTGHKSNEKYYLVSTNIKIPYWQGAASGLFKAAKELDVTPEAVGPDSYDPSAEQAAFRSAVAQNPAGIL